jgi:hypothetical protein
MVVFTQGERQVVLQCLIIGEYSTSDSARRKNIMCCCTYHTLTVIVIPPPPTTGAKTRNIQTAYEKVDDKFQMHK